MQFSALGTYQVPRGKIDTQYNNIEEDFTILQMLIDIVMDENQQLVLEEKRLEKRKKIEGNCTFRLFPIVRCQPEGTQLQIYE